MLGGQGLFHHLKNMRVREWCKNVCEFKDAVARMALHVDLPSINAIFGLKKQVHCKQPVSDVPLLCMQITTIRDSDHGNRDGEK